MKHIREVVVKMKKSYIAFSWFAAIAILVVMLWMNWAANAPTIAAWWLREQDVQTAGSWGDSFGPLNVLFSAMGFAAVLVTLLMQSEAIQNQQNDQHKQRFDLSFFELVSLMQSLRSRISYRYSEGYATARGNGQRAIRNDHEAIKIAVIELRYWIRNSGNGQASKANFVAIYDRYVHNRYESNLGPYFRILYTIMRRIKEDKFLSVQEKARYGNLLRSQLTSYEIFLISVNALSPRSNDLYELLVYFRMLKYLPNTRRNMLLPFYPAEAFLARD